MSCVLELEERVRRYQDDVFDVFERHFGGMKWGGLAKFMVKVA